MSLGVTSLGEVRVMIPTRALGAVTASETDILDGVARSLAER